MSTTGSGPRAYIGSFTSAGGRGLTEAAVDAASGALMPLRSTDVLADPSYLVLAPDSRHLYAVSETDEGAAGVFALTDEGPVLGAAPVPVGGAAPTHLALLDGHLLTANYGSGSVSVLPVRPDGGLDPAAQVLPHEGSGPDPERQEGPHAHAVVPDPSGRWVLSVDLGTDSVRVCRLAPRPRALVVHREVALRAGSGPRHLAFAPRGDRAYLVNELASTVTVCAWEPVAGALTPGVEVPLVPPGAAGGATPNYPSGVVVSRDGRFVWVANRGHDSISVLTVTEGGDGLAAVTTVDCGGHWPRALSPHPDGSRLYVANERSGDVSWFTVDAATGVPEHAGTVPVPAASCVVLVEE